MILETKSLYLTPTDDLAIGTLVLSIILSILTFFAVSLRCWIRLREGLFGADDWAMLAGMLTFQATCIVTAYGCFIGVGTRDELINMVQWSEGHKFLLIWECLYFVAAMFAKCAISLTMLRVAAKRSHKIALWTVIAVVVMTGLTGVLGGMLVCQPIEKNWDHTATPDECDYDAVLVIGFVVTATSILTDFACAGLPILVLWNMQMDRRTKVLTWVMLTLGGSASLSTIVRIPYLKYWGIDKDQLYNIANVIIWSMFECGIGIIAGSMSMLRRFVLRRLPRRRLDQEEMATPQPPTHSLITIGVFASGQKARTTSSQSNPVEMGTAVDVNRVDAYEELSGSSAGKPSISADQGVRDGVEMTDLGHKRRQGSDATDKRPLRETF
ncbi:hypothetical protein KVR01_012275 [Diaporthe batatas]|uniref:uncharacterized protein n=1 Tax=Diaporthe batatas TaxID=748121 RepID=UPI001D0587B0|nr:uncharacterized protein KVR01_012275 [Diaporthe batatas]KAG8158003.1 hypothetical protein KVR01_012275 [Diaporthe batatas]